LTLSGSEVSLGHPLSVFSYSFSPFFGNLV
jgi:hypothetical protein